MHWNHRVLNTSTEPDKDPYLEFVEVYYNDQGKPDSFCRTFMVGDDMEELKTLVERLRMALDKPVLVMMRDFDEPDPDTDATIEPTHMEDQV